MPASSPPGLRGKRSGCPTQQMLVLFLLSHPRAAKLQSRYILKSIRLLQVSVATGCAARERNIVYASGLATFFTRAYDQLRMAAISESNINLCGSHCGLSAGKESFLWLLKKRRHIRRLCFGKSFQTFAYIYMQEAQARATKS